MRLLVIALILMYSLMYSTAGFAQTVPVEIENAQVHGAQAESTQHADDVEPQSSQLEQTTLPASINHALHATVQTDRTTAYVNEQILVTLSVGAPGIAFNITGDELALNNVDMVQLNRQQSTTDINGIPYQYNKTTFAVFPREPGVLHIPALSFNALLPVSARGANDASGNPKRTAITAPLQLSIEPVPETATSWLPAQNVEITSNWSINKTASDEVRAGEPITRHVTVRLSGQHPGAVPDLEPAMQDDVRSYPDQPQMQTEAAITGLNGTLTQSYAIVASRPGEVTLPAINIDWWNINERQWRTTTLPAEQLHVVGSTLNDASASPKQLKYLYYALAGMALVLLGLTGSCITLWQRNRRLSAQLSPTRLQQTNHTERTAWSLLQRSIRQNNSMATRQALIQWARLRWPEHNIHRLEQIPVQDKALSTELMVLDEYVYGRKPAQDPDLRSMKKTLQRVRKNKSSDDSSQKILSELYRCRLRGE